MIRRIVRVLAKKHIRSLRCHVTVAQEVFLESFRSVSSNRRALKRHAEQMFVVHGHHPGEGMGPWVFTIKAWNDDVIMVGKGPIADPDIIG